MTPEEYTARFKKTISDLERQDSGELMASVGLVALTLLRQRVQETGVDAEGKKYKPYSTKAMLVGCKTFLRADACAKVLGSKQKRKELQWRTIGKGDQAKRLAILPGGYKKVRELQGRQTDHVDFMVTGNMWNNISLISKQSDHQNGVAVIGARAEEEKKKLAGNTNRRGDILDLSTKEQTELIKRYNLQALQIFKENGL